MNRNQRVLASVDTAGLGLEIGPSYNPIAPKRDGYRVRTMDHADRDALIVKYRGLGLSEAQIERIEDVDYVWEGQPLRKAVADGTLFDYIIASHVVEHTVDLIGFFNECAELLTDRGVVSLVIPDKRFCFDHFRPLTSAGQVVEAHLLGRQFHGPASFVDTHLYTVKRDGVDNAWPPRDPGRLELAACSWEGVLQTVSKVMQQDTYIDIHRWVFTPSSFRLLMRDLAALGYLDVVVDSVTTTGDFEFLATLRPRRPSDTFAGVASRERRQLLDAVTEELLAATPPAKRRLKLRSAARRSLRRGRDLARRTRAAALRH